MNTNEVSLETKTKSITYRAVSVLADSLPYILNSTKTITDSTIKTVISQILLGSGMSNLIAPMEEQKLINYLISNSYCKRVKDKDGVYEILPEFLRLSQILTFFKINSLNSVMVYLYLKEKPESIKKLEDIILNKDIKDLDKEIQKSDIKDLYFLLLKDKEGDSEKLDPNMTKRLIYSLKFISYLYHKEDQK